VFEDVEEEYVVDAAGRGSWQPLVLGRAGAPEEGKGKAKAKTARKDKAAAAAAAEAEAQGAGDGGPAMMREEI
jgi:hypothetical protein